MNKTTLFLVVFGLFLISAQAVLGASAYIDGVLVSTADCSSPPAPSYLNLNKCNTPSYFIAGQQVWHCIKMITNVGGGAVTGKYSVDGIEKSSNSVSAYPAPQQYQLRCDYYKTYTNAETGSHTFKGEVSPCGGGTCSKSVTFEIKPAPKADNTLTDFYLKDSNSNKKTTFNVGESIKPCALVYNKGNADETNLQTTFNVGPNTQTLDYGKNVGAGQIEEKCGSSVTFSSAGTFNAQVSISPCSSGCSKTISFTVNEVCTPKMWYYDNDGDGYGISSNIKLECSKPNGYGDKNGDCNDNDASINPGKTEICDNKDNNCANGVDENNVCFTTYYCDSDGDGYKSQSSSGTCNSPNCMPAGCSANSGNDCNDGKSSVNPGATEICGNGIDDNCDGIAPETCKPEMSILDLYVSPSGPSPGDQITMNMKVKNNGEAGVYWRDFSILKDGQTVGGPWGQGNIAIGKGEEQPQSLPYNVPLGWACGNYVLKGGVQPPLPEIYKETPFTIACKCTDADGDSYGAGCTNGADCDDTNFNVHSAQSCTNYNTCGTEQLCVAQCPAKPQEVLCDGKDNDCDANTKDDNCGAGKTCDFGTKQCANTICIAGTQSCDGSWINGCEVNINSDVNNCGSCNAKCQTGQTCVSGTCAWNTHFLIYNAPSEEIKSKALEYLEQAYVSLTSPFDKNKLWNQPIEVDFIQKDTALDQYSWFSGTIGQTQSDPIQIFYSSDWVNKKSQDQTKFYQDLKIVSAHEFTHLLTKQFSGPYMSEGLADWGAYAVFGLIPNQYTKKYQHVGCDQKFMDLFLEKDIGTDQFMQQLSRSASLDLLIEVLGNKVANFKIFIDKYQACESKDCAFSGAYAQITGQQKTVSEIISAKWWCSEVFLMSKEEYQKLYDILQQHQKLSLLVDATVNDQTAMINKIEQDTKQVAEIDLSSTVGTTTKVLGIIGVNAKNLQKIDTLKEAVEVENILDDLGYAKKGPAEEVFVGIEKSIANTAGQIPVSDYKKLSKYVSDAALITYFVYKVAQCGEPVTALVYTGIEMGENTFLAPVKGLALMSWGSSSVALAAGCSNDPSLQCQAMKAANDYSSFYLGITEKLLGQCLQFPQYTCVYTSYGMICYTPKDKAPLEIYPKVIKNDNAASFEIKLVNKAYWHKEEDDPKGFGYFILDVYKQASYIYVDSIILDKSSSELYAYPTQEIDLTELYPPFSAPQLNLEKTLSFAEFSLAKNKEYNFQVEVWWCGDKTWGKPGKYDNCLKVSNTITPFVLENQPPIINSVTCNSLTQLGVSCPKDINVYAGDKLTLTLTTHDLDNNSLQINYAGDYPAGSTKSCKTISEDPHGEECTFTFQFKQEDTGKPGYYVNLAVSDGIESAPLESFNFNVLENSPQLTSPADGDTTNTQNPMFKWTGIASAQPVNYKINLYTDPSQSPKYTTPLFPDPNPASPNKEHKLTEYTLEKHKYYWWDVVGINNYGIELKSNSKNKFWVDCAADIDCGTLYSNGLSCGSDGVYEEIVTPKCVEPETTNSQCIFEPQKVQKQACLFGCSSNSCIAPVQDDDADKDGILSVIDNCPLASNPFQEDYDKDGLGNVCDEDDDNDGFTDSSDCSPLNPLFPTAEVCDNVDNDCDGQTDEGLTFFNIYPDNDGDGYGDGASLPKSVCKIPESGSWVANNGDCWDKDKTYSKLLTCNYTPVTGCGKQSVCALSCPTIPQETCNNKDDDCDGVADNGFNLQSDSQNCGSCGNACSAGQTCTAGKCLSTEKPNLKISSLKLLKVKLISKNQCRAYFEMKAVNNGTAVADDISWQVTSQNKDVLKSGLYSQKTLPGQSKTLLFNFPFSGNVQPAFTLDYQDQIIESNENDNSKTYPIKLSCPPSEKSQYVLKKK